jgi:hypothetical protein
MDDISYLRIGDIVINEDQYVSYDDQDGDFVDGCLLKEEGDSSPSYDQITSGFSSSLSSTGPSKASLLCLGLYILNAFIFGLFGVWSLHGNLPKQTDIWNIHMVR